MDAVSDDVLLELSLSDANVVYYVAGFIATSLTKNTNCPYCLSILGKRSDDISNVMEGALPTEWQRFINSINHGSLIKPSCPSHAGGIIWINSEKCQSESFQRNAKKFTCTQHSNIHTV